MKKRLLVLFITIAFTVSSIFTSFANSEQSKTISTDVISSILIDGKSIDTSNYTIDSNENTAAMYPLRLIAENLGAEVSWDNTRKCVVILYMNGEISLTPDTKIVTINGVDKKLSYNIDNKNSRIYVPTDFISQILGARVSLDSKTKTMSIQKPSASLETQVLSESEQKIQDNLATYLTSLELNRNFSGQILVETDGKIFIDRSYGYADYENHIKPFNTTTFAIGSVTKQFTAAAIAQLAEKGTLSYNDNVSKYLSNVPFGDKITIHQLLTHTSGLFNITNIAELYRIQPSEMTFDKLIPMIKDKPLDFEPGTKWSYSNTGYLVLGAIVEKISGKTLGNYMKENIFEPVGMKNTNISYDLDQKIVEAKGYTGYMDVVPESLDMILLNAAYGAGFLCSTAEDLYKWDLALQRGQVISKESLSKVFSKYSETKVIGHYGYGWSLTTGAYGEEISHGGNTFGFTSDNAMFPDKNAHIIILTNKGYANVVSIKENIIKILNGNIVTPLKERGSYAIPSLELTKYTGSFKAKDFEVNIVNNSGTLMLNLPGLTSKMVAESEGKLYSRDFDIELEYTINTKQEVTAIVLQVFGVRTICEKSADRTYIKLTDEQLKKFAGTYEIKNVFEFVVSVKDGKLTFQADGQPSFEVSPLSETEFESLLYGVKIKFDSKDTPKECIIYQAGQQLSAYKLN
ncbi:MAG: hypothetical protein CVU84_12085 [Firmicutes bacterium HGW-Firmicutes-1]|jgi:CubicO group peptidase (beta-lactamase class C family)|nr:MAG: hypothetical protein CVU84_12085 [Firmicutes bacterium HGW-Firmicutes-1]